ncbi:MAG: 4-hydroxy-tetrahydrodipicolinate synthase [Verrucomicrobiota bacterium]|jgi:4-hydroxy-tetrahydrodipicolinate synthase
MFTGTYTAIVTPFRDGELDERALEVLIRGQVKGGVDGIVPAGTTGESPTLGVEEHIRLVELCVKLSRGRIKVIAGTGANSTEEAIHLTQAAEKVGADGSLQVCPYYNKPSQEGVFEHFKAIARATKLPLMLYSIPGRCGIEIGVETVVRLAKACRNVVAIKEAGGQTDRVSQLRAACRDRITILSGDDALTLPFMSVGAEGVVSVASNVDPRRVSRMVKAYRAGDVKKARQLHEELYELFKDLFIETNPVPAKVALSMMGQMEEGVRLPLVGISAANRAKLRGTLKRSGLLRK